MKETLQEVYEHLEEVLDEVYDDENYPRRDWMIETLEDMMDKTQEALRLLRG